MTQAVCTSYKRELFEAVHNHLASGGHVFKLALYTATATLNETTTVYAASNEVASANYTAGGFVLTNVNPTASGVTIIIDFSVDPNWTTVSFTTSQALIYNTSAGNKAVMVLDFGGSFTVTSGDFVVTFPPAAATTALLTLN